MSSHKVYFEPSIITVCSWFRANYDYHHSSGVSRDSVWRNFVADHKKQGFSVKDSQFNEFFGYVGEYIAKSAALRNVVLDKNKKQYVNLQQRRSSSPEECETLDVLIRFWLMKSYEEASENHEIHVIKIYSEFCSKFRLDSYDRIVKRAIYTAIISNIGDVIENGAFSKVTSIRRVVFGIAKCEEPSGMFSNISLQCSSSGLVKITWKIPYDELSHELSMARPAGRVLFPLSTSCSRAAAHSSRKCEEHSSVELHSVPTISPSLTATTSSDRGSTDASVRSTMNYLKRFLSDVQEQEQQNYCHQHSTPEYSTKKFKIKKYDDDQPSIDSTAVDDMLDASLACKGEIIEMDENTGVPSHLANNLVSPTTETIATAAYNSHCLSSVLLHCQSDIQFVPNSTQQVNPQSGHWDFCSSIPEFLSLCSQGVSTTAWLVVTEVMRFIPDWSFDPDVCGPINEACPEAFDLVVFDGCGYIKIVLHTSCNFLVQKHFLFSNCFVKVSEFALAFKDNKPVVVAGLVDVLEATLTDQQLDFIAKVREMPQYKITIMKPSLTFREYYVSMWTNEDPLEPGYWSSLCAGRVVKSCNMESLSNIAKILEKFDSEHASETLHLSIAGRILSKSRMIHFAKVVSSMTTSFPFQFYVEIADATACVFLVFWGLNALQWFDQIEVGDVIAAEGFTVRKFNPNLPQNWRRFSHKSKGIQELEFSLSYSSPLRKVTSARETESLHLPQVTYTFVSHSDLTKSSDGMIFDVFGIIVYASRVERVKRKVRQPVASTEIQTPDVNSCIYWQYRWIGLVDGSSSQPCFLKLFTCCQQEFHHLQPGQLMVCSNVCVKSNTTTSRMPRNVYVTSTVESQFYILSDVTSFGGTTVEREPLVYRTLNIAQLKEVEPLLLASIVGGYMVLPYDFNMLHYNNGDEDSHLEKVKGEQLCKICDALCYQESHQVLVNAEVVRVEFVKVSEDLLDISSPEHNHHVIENHERLEEFPDIDFVGIEYLDPSVLWEPYTANVMDANHILPNNKGYWVLSLLTEDLKAIVNVSYLLIDRNYWLFPHLKDQAISPFEKLLEMPICDKEMINRKLELVSQNLFDRDMSFALQLYSLGGDNIEIIVQGAELLSA